MTDKTDIAALREAAIKATCGDWCTDSQHSVIADAGLNANYYVAACSGPDCKENAKFIALANPATILTLLDQLEAERQQQEAAEHALEVAVKCANSGAVELRERAEAAEKERDRLDASETQLIDERDSAEQALSDMYEAATGNRPEWSNMFQFADAVEEVSDTVAELRAKLEATEKERDGLLVWKKLAAQRYEKLQALRAKLANPVVLNNALDHYQDPDEYEQGYVRGCNASRIEAIAAIRAAGFTVKGE
ncbi:ead/Ea22-like family protein [Rahnella sp. ChDrAdgB13]|uniref:ead/Ea22-like family protein n=1 Tax=Rahnella sp. ChDrAdgB13 TaxID=1850581 RepID=UPI001AD855D8|nr:ead/Ea22-like family protein [Rahnella sp. ChDrAdgB13]